MVDRPAYLFLPPPLSLAYCRLVSMIAANHAKASMILVVMLDPSMTVRPVKLTLSLTGSHTFFLHAMIMLEGPKPPPASP